MKNVKRRSRILVGFLVLAVMLFTLLAVSAFATDSGSDPAPAPDLSGVSFSDKAVKYDGELHSIEIAGTLPDGVEVSYSDAVSAAKRRMK